MVKKALKKIAKVGPVKGGPAKAGPGPVMRYVLIAAIVALLGFTGFYMYSIIKSTTEKYENKPSFKVVFIYSNNCMYCTKFKPTFANTMTQLGLPNKDVEVLQLESSDPKASEYSKHSEGVPYVLVFKNGEFSDKQVGNVESVAFTNWLKAKTSLL